MQFVAMPLGAGYSAEEQFTGKTEHAALQLAVFPMKREVFERRFPKADTRWLGCMARYDFGELCEAAPDMGLAPGGRVRQEIYSDPYELDDWQLDSTSRCFVHLCKSLVWQSVTGSPPPRPAPASTNEIPAAYP